MFLIVAVLKKDKEVSVRTSPYEPCLLQFPTMAFMKPKEMVMEKKFKQTVVRFLLNKFECKLHDIHSVVIAFENKVVCRWRSNRGHFKEIQ